MELALWTFFAIRRDASGEHFVAIWVPLVIITRTVLTDMVRSVAAANGQLPFGGTDGAATRGWVWQLTGARWSRATYGTLKAVCFCALGLLLAWPALRSAASFAVTARLVTDVLVYATTVFAVLRGIPVLWEGRRFLKVERLDSNRSLVRPRPSSR